jgi:hypothetical protein
MSETLWAVIVGGLLTLSGGLGGTALGWWLNGRSERRGEKRSAFVELLTAMDGCQQACSELSTFISQARTDLELLGPRAKLVAAMNRVETASNLAILAVGREHEKVLRNGAIACGSEAKVANHGGPDTMAIQEAWWPILELGRSELR